jgi:simple sugar transport system permease protein
LLIAATLNAGTVLAIAALGLLINEKAGVVNLGAEGMMLCAAIAGFACVVHTGNDWLGFAAGMGAGAVLAAIFGVLVIWLNTNQYATGLALSLFGVGFSAFVGIGYVQEKLPERPNYEIPFLADIPLLGPAFFKQHPLVYGAIFLVLALIWFLYKSRTGLVLRAVGESPASAHALGYPVRLIRLAAVVAGGALCGLAGAYISVSYTPLWVEGMVAGKGTCIAWGLPVWWCDHAAVPFARGGCASAQSVAHGAALHRHHRGAGLDFTKPYLDSGQHAGLFG